jgi:hypothetical protein
MCDKKQILDQIERLFKVLVNEHDALIATSIISFTDGEHYEKSVISSCVEQQSQHDVACLPLP